MRRNVIRTNLLDLSKPRSLNVSGRDKLAQLVKRFGNRVSVATTVNGTFFDVLVPELHVGVVFDSVSVDFYSTPTDKLQRVSRSAQKSGLTCIHVFDWDDNVLCMPTRIHMERLDEHGNWVPHVCTTSTFSVIRKDTAHYRFPMGRREMAFVEFQDERTPLGGGCFIAV